MREHGARAAARLPALRRPPAARAELGRGEGYDYPHDHPGTSPRRSCCPTDVEGARFYEPDEAEAELRERLEEIRRARGRDP